MHLERDLYPELQAALIAWAPIHMPTSPARELCLCGAKWLCRHAGEPWDDAQITDVRSLGDALVLETPGGSFMLTIERIDRPRAQDHYDLRAITMILDRYGAPDVTPGPDGSHRHLEPGRAVGVLAQPVEPPWLHPAAGAAGGDRPAACQDRGPGAGVGGRGRGSLAGAASRIRPTPGPAGPIAVRFLPAECVPSPTGETPAPPGCDMRRPAAGSPPRRRGLELQPTRLPGDPAAASAVGRDQSAPLPTTRQAGTASAVSAWHRMEPDGSTRTRPRRSCGCSRPSTPTWAGRHMRRRRRMVLRDIDVLRHLHRTPRPSWPSAPGWPGATPAAASAGCTGAACGCATAATSTSAEEVAASA